jgi:lysophospholipase L1-like esterase
LKKKIINILLLFSSILISILISEILLRIISPNQYFIWPPDLKQYFLPDSAVFAGIKDTSFFKINSSGFRGNEKKDSNLIHIVTIGGSTTECLYLDQSETWPALLEKFLNESFNEKFQIFNGGRSGLNSNHHLLQIQKLLEEDNWIDVIIVLEGINDLQYALSLGKNYQKENSQSIYDKSFLVSPVNNELPFYKRSYLYMYLTKLQRAISSYKSAQDPYGYDYIKWRKNRANASEIIDSIPNLSSSLSNFEHNNESMIDIAKSKNKRIIFLTQPVSWDNSMPPYQKKLCWFGWIGSDQYKNTGFYYSFSALKKSLDKYNSLLKETCKERNVECLSLDSILEKDTTTFYDDCHFNESGSTKVAKKILMFINSKFNQPIKRTP